MVHVWMRVANRIGFGVISEGSVAFRREKASLRRFFLQRMNILDCFSDGSDIEPSDCYQPLGCADSELTRLEEGRLF